MRLFNLSAEAYSQYINSVKGNANLTYNEARLKLVRNILLSIPIIQEKENFGGQWYAYGKLRILVDTKYKEIICVLNNQPIPKKWTPNADLKEIADITLGLK